MNYEVTNEVIYQTKDYDEFKKLLGNRLIDEANVKSIMEKIKTIGYRKSIVIVNSKFEIIDGQHRVEALRRLNMPVKFVIDEDADIDTCIALNIKSNTWKITDFIKCYVEMGKKDYEILTEEINNHPYLLSINVAKALGATLNGRRIQNELKSGEYKINNYGFGKQCLRFFDDIHKTVEKIDCKKSTVYDTLQGLISLDLIDTDRMADSINRYYGQCKYIGDVNSALESLQELYNYNRRTKVYFKDEYVQQMTNKQLNNINKRKTKTN